MSNIQLGTRRHDWPWLLIHQVQVSCGCIQLLMNPLKAPGMVNYWLQTAGSQLADQVWSKAASCSHAIGLKVEGLELATLNHG